METQELSARIDAAAEILRAGGLVAVPTETVYGLAANGFLEDAVSKIYEVKGRPENKPLSLMVKGADAIDALCEDVPKAAYILAEVFWPGPLTIVLKAKKTIPDIVRAGGDTVGLRCPDHPQLSALLNTIDFPLAAPSANPSGEKSPVKAQDVLKYFDGKIEGIIDGGECTLGRESTIIDLSKTPYTVLREGAVSSDDVFMALTASLTIIGITGGTGSGKTTALNAIHDMGGLVIDAGHQQLVDTVVIDIHHFKFVAGEFHRIGAFRDLTQHKHHKASDGFVVARLRELVNIQHAHDVVNWGAAVNQP